MYKWRWCPGKEHQFVLASHSGCVYTFDNRRPTTHSTVYNSKESSNLSPVLDVAFSCDGHYLVSADKASTIRLYDVGRGDPITSSRSPQLLGAPSIAWTEPSMMDDDDMKVITAWDKDRDTGAIRSWQGHASHSKANMK